MKTELFQSCGHCWVFQICWHIECSIFTASSFRIWNSSTGIPSPPLALFVVMLPKAPLTSHSRMSGYRWVITALWLSVSWRSFLYSSSVYSCHLFLMSSASVRSLPFLSLIEHEIQNKSKHKYNKCFSWVTAVRVLSLSGSHSPPNLPRIPSNTVLISGPALGAAQILIWSYSCVFLIPMSTAVRTLIPMSTAVSFCGSSQWPFIYSTDTESA